MQLTAVTNVTNVTAGTIVTKETGNRLNSSNNSNAHNVTKFFVTQLRNISKVICNINSYFLFEVICNCSNITL